MEETGKKWRVIYKQELVHKLDLMLKNISRDYKINKYNINNTIIFHFLITYCNLFIYKGKYN